MSINRIGQLLLQNSAGSFMRAFVREVRIDYDSASRGTGSMEIMMLPDAPEDLGRFFEEMQQSPNVVPTPPRRLPQGEAGDILVCTGNLGGTEWIEPDDIGDYVRAGLERVTESRNGSDLERLGAIVDVERAPNENDRNYRDRIYHAIRQLGDAESDVVIATTGTLDAMGEMRGITRYPAESDNHYRERILESMSSNRGINIIAGENVRIQRDQPIYLGIDPAVEHIPVGTIMPRRVPRFEPVRLDINATINPSVPVDVVDHIWDGGAWVELTAEVRRRIADLPDQADSGSIQRAIRGQVNNYVMGAQINFRNMGDTAPIRMSTNPSDVSIYGNRFTGRTRNWWRGAHPPGDPSIGQEGDHWLNTLTGTIYTKRGTTWERATGVLPPDAGTVFENERVTFSGNLPPGINAGQEYYIQAQEESIAGMTDREAFLLLTRQHRIPPYIRSDAEAQQFARAALSIAQATGTSLFAAASQLANAVNNDFGGTDNGVVFQKNPHTGMKLYEIPDGEDLHWLMDRVDLHDGDMAVVVDSLFRWDFDTTGGRWTKCDEKGNFVRTNKKKKRVMRKVDMIDVHHTDIIEDEE